MNILILRTYLPDRTNGKLTIEDNGFACDVLERSKDIPEHPCIPEGTYGVTTYISPHNKMEVPLLEDVPERTMIEIHPANYVSELLGCIAPGVTCSTGVSNSRITFAPLMKLIKEAISTGERVYVTFKDQRSNIT